MRRPPAVVAGASGLASRQAPPGPGRLCAGTVAGQGSASDHRIAAPAPAVRPLASLACPRPPRARPHSTYEMYAVAERQFVTIGALLFSATSTMTLRHSGLNFFGFDTSSLFDFQVIVSSKTRKQSL